MKSPIEVFDGLAELLCHFAGSDIAYPGTEFGQGSYQTPGHLYIDSSFQEDLDIILRCLPEKLGYDIQEVYEDKLGAEWLILEYQKKSS